MPMGTNMSVTATLVATAATLILHPMRYANRKPTSIQAAAAPTTKTAQFDSLTELTKDLLPGKVKPQMIQTTIPTR